MPYLAPFLIYGDLLAQNGQFLTPLSFSDFDRGDPLRILGKALRILKLESTVKILKTKV